MSGYKDINFGGECLQLDRFDLKNLVLDSSGDFLNPRIAIIAKSGSGKSWVIRDILSYIKDIPCGTIIAPTDKMTGFYNDFFPVSFIHHEYKEDTIPRMLARQKIILSKNDDRKKKGKKLIDPRTFLIMDDCMSSKHLWLKDPNVLSIFNEGRHYQLTFILSMQYSLGIQPELRSNFDFVFLLGEDFINNRKKLYEHYAGMFPSRELFDQVFLQVTDDYGVMVINNRLRSSDIRKKVFWYKAKVKGDLSVGCSRFKSFHKLYYDENHDKRLPFIDMNNFGTKKKTNVHVVKRVEEDDDEN
tara:strand:- start:2705 stop:3604 length:900 start_codon:yes stop_codon:yes gene_type:complete